MRLPRAPYALEYTRKVHSSTPNEPGVQQSAHTTMAASTNDNMDYITCQLGCQNCSNDECRARFRKAGCDCV